MTTNSPLCKDEKKYFMRSINVLGAWIFVLLVLIIVLSICFQRGISNISDRDCKKTQTYFNSSLPCNEAGDKYFVVNCNYTTCYACEHNGQRRLLIHNSYYDKINVTIDGLPENLRYFVDNKTKDIYNVKNGIVSLGVLDYNENVLLIEVSLDERYPYEVLRKFCPNGNIRGYQKRGSMIYEMECLENGK